MLSSLIWMVAPLIVVTAAQRHGLSCFGLYLCGCCASLFALTFKPFIQALMRPREVIVTNAQPTRDDLHHLRSLHELLRAGAITDEEYRRQKSALLATTID